MQEIQKRKPILTCKIQELLMQNFVIREKAQPEAMGVERLYL
jgi:hypothetical protein